jgi:DNA-binding MarR family transcriptional regulator
VKLKKGSVTDEMISEHMGRASGKEVVKKPPKEKTGKTGLPEINRHGWNILKCLGKGEGSFTSQIYSRAGISGSVFNKEIRKLIEWGAVGKCEGKVGKNRLYYYFLTPIGRRYFRNKFGDFSLEVETKLNDVLEMYSLFGFRVTRREDQLVLRKKKSGKTFRIFLIEKLDRDHIRSLVQDGRQYLCANRVLLNVLMQEASKYCSKMGKGISFLVSTPDELVERGDFQKVEIGIPA